MKAILFALLSLMYVPLDAGCLIGDVINHTTTCTLYLRNQMAPAKRNISDPDTKTNFNETVGEYIIFMVREQLAEGQICKQYQIKVDETEKNIGNIRLLRSNSCGKEANFDIFMEEFSNIPIKRCLINIHIYDSNDVRLEIIDDSTKNEKPVMNVPQRQYGFSW